MKFITQIASIPIMLLATFLLLNEWLAFVVFDSLVVYFTLVAMVVGLSIGKLAFQFTNQWAKELNFLFISLLINGLLIANENAWLTISQSPTMQQFWVFATLLYILMDTIFSLIIGKSNDNKKNPFPKVQRKNNIIFIAAWIIGLVFFVLYYRSQSSISENILLTFSAVMLSLQFPFHKQYMQYLNKKVDTYFQKYDFPPSMLPYWDSLSKIRNFAFDKELLYDQNYSFQSMDSHHSVTPQRSLIRIKYLLKGWKPLFEKAIEDKIDKSLAINITISETTENYVRANDDDKNSYLLTTFDGVADQVDVQRHDLYFLKNDQIVNRIALADEPRKDTENLVEQFNPLGNTVVFSADNEQLGQEVLFHTRADKVYFGINRNRQQKLIRLLNEKAPTAVFSSDNRFASSASLFFPITNKAEHALSTDALLKIPALFEWSDRIRLRLQMWSNVIILYNLLISILLIVGSINLFVGLGAWFGVSLFAFFVLPSLLFLLSDKQQAENLHEKEDS